MPLYLTAWENCGSGLGAFSVSTASALLILLDCEKVTKTNTPGHGVFFLLTQVEREDDRNGGEWEITAEDGGRGEDRIMPVPGRPLPCGVGSDDWAERVKVTPGGSTNPQRSLHATNPNF